MKWSEVKSVLITLILEWITSETKQTKNQSTIYQKQYDNDKKLGTTTYHKEDAFDVAPMLAITYLWFHCLVNCFLGQGLILLVSRHQMFLEVQQELSIEQKKVVSERDSGWCPCNDQKQIIF